MEHLYTRVSVFEAKNDFYGPNYLCTNCTLKVHQFERTIGVHRRTRNLTSSRLDLRKTSKKTVYYVLYCPMNANAANKGER